MITLGPLVTLSCSGFSWVWLLPGLTSRLGFSPLEPDAVQDLDWTVAGNQSETVMDLKTFFCFLLSGVLVLSLMRFTPALKIEQAFLT